MYFDFTDEQRAIKEAARAFLASRYTSEARREIAASAEGFDADGWREMADLGWAGLAVPERWGGQELGTVELAVLFEELGYAAAPSPLLSTTYVGLMLARCAGDDQCERYLQPLSAGEVIGTAAPADLETSTSAPSLVARAIDDGGVRLDGEKTVVPDAAIADFLIVADDAGRRHLVSTKSPGVSIVEQTSIDTTRRLSRVTFDGVEVPAADTLPASDGYAEVFDLMAVAVAAEAVGVAQRALEMGVEYAGQRQQFGRPIGAFQAISHRCAQMLLETENSRSLVYGAAWAADAEPESLPVAASMAKAYASDTGRRVPDHSIQVHGGIGFTWEHDLHFFLKRGVLDAILFGDARTHRERVATHALSGAGS